MNVAAILKEKGSEIITARPGQSVREVMDLLASKRIGAVLIVDSDNGLAGVVSERDIVRELSRQGVACLDLEVSDLMTKDVISCAPSDSIGTVMGTMTAKRIRHLPVMREGQLEGFISIGDVVKARIQEIEQEAEALRQYITA